MNSALHSLGLAAPLAIRSLAQAGAAGTAAEATPKLANTTFTSSRFAPAGLKASGLARARASAQSIQPDRLPLGLALTLASDSGALGNSQTRFATVDLVGLTAPNARITLNGQNTTAAADGRFLFANLPLPLGKTQLTATAQSGSRRSSFTTYVERVSADSTDAVVTWNAVALRTLQLDRAGSLEASRTLAMMHSAIYRAVQVAQPGSAISVLVDAAAAAAHRILTQLYPSQQPQLDAILAESLAGISSPNFLLGQTAADQVLAQRSLDGSDRSIAVRAQLQPGKWRPTPPRFLPAAGAAWAKVMPFVLRQADQFRPGPPPRLTGQLTGQLYARELNQVKRLGEIDSRERSVSQTDTARFWIGSAEAGTFPGLWNQVAERLAVQQTAVPTAETLLQNARRFAQLNLALADAGIAAWDTKYAYRSWRPITAIRLATSDRNSATKADRTWQSYLETPAHPDYVSGHSSFSGAAAAVLAQSFGSQPFSVTSLDLPGETKVFQSFQQAAAEAGISRLYGGIHTMSANRVGQKLGRQVAQLVLHEFDHLSPQN